MLVQKTLRVAKQGYKKIRGVYFYILCLFLANGDLVFATNKIENSVMYTGTVKLIKDAFRAVQVISVLVGVIVILFLLGKKQVEDDVDSKVTKKKIRTVVITMIAILLIVEILNLILGYYTSTTITM